MIPAPFRYPFRSDRGVDTLLIGGGLHLAAVYIPIVPLIVVAGYLVTVLAETAGRDRLTRFESLPPFEDVRSMTRLGIGGCAIAIAFLLPAGGILLVTVFGITNQAPTPTTVDFGTSLGFVAGSTASLLLALSVLYVLPAALVSYVSRRRLRAAFDTRVLVTAATDGTYFYNVTVGLVVGALLLTLASGLVDVVVGFFLAFYAELVMVGYWSRGASLALPSDAS
ncbi:DUF4013 domain-containing protein [Halohasta salina]|uniref:DUF4013 domain-containing protein n=1 Tax=Halohasta salina TaxID=2961621 RepID=UPI0020A518A5|nr:DUF4013 domain-containing protein [Halohasta salina]